MGKEIVKLTDKPINVKMAKLGVGRLNKAVGNEVFPLQTIQSMSERWDVDRATVANWRVRDLNFPREIEGLVEQTARMPRFFAHCDVLAYEKLKGLGQRDEA